MLMISPKIFLGLFLWCLVDIKEEASFKLRNIKALMIYFVRTWFPTVGVLVLYSTKSIAHKMPPMIQVREMNLGELVSL